jgi:hypothetical protein
MGEVSIQPFDCTDVKTATSFRVEIQELTLFQSVNVRVELLNDNGHIVHIKYVLIDGDDYKNWNNDDRYIIQKVAEKLGIVII